MSDRSRRRRRSCGDRCPNMHAGAIVEVSASRRSASARAQRQRRTARGSRRPRSSRRRRRWCERIFAVDRHRRAPSPAVRMVAGCSRETRVARPDCRTARRSDVLADRDAVVRAGAHGRGRCAVVDDRSVAAVRRLMRRDRTGLANASVGEHAIPMTSAATGDLWRARHAGRPPQASRRVAARTRPARRRARHELLSCARQP